jgi:hypothetical protein
MPLVVWLALDIGEVVGSKLQSQFGSADMYFVVFSFPPDSFRDSSLM